jgi:hypothetical protein
LARTIGRSEIELLVLTVSFQIVALFSLLRVATGSASVSPPSQNSSVIQVPSLNQSVIIPQTTPQFANPVGSSLSASLILALIFVAANVVVIGFLAYLYRRRKMKWFSLIISLFLIFNVTELYFTFLTGVYSYIPFVAAFAALAITVIAALRGLSPLINGMSFVLALELGSSFAVLLQAPLNWIIPLVYAIFDIYAVYYGRLGKLVKEVSATENGKEKNASEPDSTAYRKSSDQGRLSKWPDFGLLSIRLSTIEIGMADIAFYAMVPGVALLLSNLFGFFVVMIAVDVGIVLSFSLFKRSEVAPGLPVPILLGLAALLVFVLVR